MFFCFKAPKILSEIFESRKNYLNTILFCNQTILVLLCVFWLTFFDASTTEHNSNYHTSTFACRHLEAALDAAQSVAFEVC